MFPHCAATMRGVLPSLFLAFASAPHWRRRRKMARRSGRPETAWRAVLPPFTGRSVTLTSRSAMGNDFFLLKRFSRGTKAGVVRIEENSWKNFHFRPQTGRDRIRDRQNGSISTRSNSIDLRHNPSIDNCRIVYFLIRFRQSNLAASFPHSIVQRTQGKVNR